MDQSIIIGDTSEKHGIIFRVVLVTPELAAKWLERNAKDQRSIRPKRVAALARTIDHGDFFLTHQGIAFFPDGTLFDGQHRLSGIVSSGRSQWIVVAWFTDSDHAAKAQAVIDGGIKRGAGDALDARGVTNGRNVAAVINAMWNIETGNDQPLDNPSIIRTYGAHRTAIDWSFTAFPDNGWSAIVRASFAYAYPVNPAQVAEMARQVVEKTNLTEGSAAHVFVQSSGAFKGKKHKSGGDFRRDAMFKILRLIAGHIGALDVPRKLQSGSGGATYFRKARTRLALTLANVEAP